MIDATNIPAMPTDKASQKAEFPTYRGMVGLYYVTAPGLIPAIRKVGQSIAQNVFGDRTRGSDGFPVEAGDLVAESRVEDNTKVSLAGAIDEAPVTDELGRLSGNSTLVQMS